MKILIFWATVIGYSYNFNILAHCCRLQLSKKREKKNCCRLQLQTCRKMSYFNDHIGSFDLLALMALVSMES